MHLQFLQGLIGFEDFAEDDRQDYGMDIGDYDSEDSECSE